MALLHGTDLSEHLKEVKDKEDADKRIEICTVAINKVLKDNDCKLDAIMIIGSGGAVPQITIIANSKK